MAVVGLIGEARNSVAGRAASRRSRERTWRRFAFAFALAVVVGAGGPARGQVSFQAYVGLGAESDLDFEIATGGLELQLPGGVWGVRPTLGVLADSEGDLYGYLGLRRDFAWRSLRASPMLGLGSYESKGGIDLGGPLQYRTGLEVSTTIHEWGQLGLLVFHLSNAGIENRNPGTETLVITFTRELRRRRR